MSEKTTQNNEEAESPKIEKLSGNRLIELMAKMKSFITRNIFQSYVVMTILFLWLPLLVIIILSFAVNSDTFTPFQGFTLNNYRSLFEDESLLYSAWSSAQVATVSAILSTILGVLTAFGLVRQDFKFKRFIRASVIFPLVIPGVILGVSLLIYFRTIIGIGTGFLTTVATFTVYGYPFVVLPVTARLASFDRSLEEGARDLGASSARSVWDITLPVISPAIGAGFLFAWVRAFEDFTRAFFVSGTVSLVTKQMYGLVVFAQSKSILKPMVTLIIFVIGFIILTAMYFSSNITEYI